MKSYLFAKLPSLLSLGLGQPTCGNMNGPTMRDLLTMKQAAFLLLFLWTAMANLSGQNPAPGQSPQAIVTGSFNGMVEEFFDHYFHFHPTEGTYAGLHQYLSLIHI